MKQILPVLVFCLGFSFFYTSSEAQGLKGLSNKVKQKAGQRADQKVDKSIDKGLDEVENGTKVKKDEDGDTK